MRAFLWKNYDGVPIPTEAEEENERRERALRLENILQLTTCLRRAP